MWQGIDDTNNMIAECNLSVFDQKSKVAKSKNCKFKAKGIRNEVVRLKSSFSVTPNHPMKKMATLLNKIEDEWSAQQKTKLKEKLKEKMEMVKKQSQYVNKLLSQCKSWDGPVCSIEELQWAMKKRPDAAEIMLKFNSNITNTHIVQK